MAQPMRRQVATAESPDLPRSRSAIVSPITYSTNVFGKSFGFTTSTTIRPGTTSEATPSRATTTQESAEVSTTRPSPPRLTATVFTVAGGGRSTVIGSIVPLSTRAPDGKPVRSGIANASTTYLIEAQSTSAPRSSASAAAPAAAEGSSSGLSPGEIAAAVVVPIVVVIAAAVAGFFLFRRRRRRRRGTDASTRSGAQLGQGAAREGSASPALALDEKTVGDTAPYITSDVLHNYNTGLDSVVTTTASEGGSGVGGAVSSSSAAAAAAAAATAAGGHGRNQHGTSNLSNPFTDVSGASSQKGSDMFAGFSGGGTKHSSSAPTTRTSNTPARGVSPVPEATSPRSGRGRRHDDDDDDNDDAVASGASDDEDDTEVHVAQAHMGRAHRASVITMRGMVGGSNGSSPRGSAKGSPDNGSPIRDA